MTEAESTERNEGVPLPLVAQRAGVSYHAAWNDLLRGRLRGKKVGHIWLVDPDSAIAYIATRTPLVPA